MRRVDCLPVRVSPREDGAPQHYFFGYYDKQPWDASGEHILAHRASFLDRFPNFDDRAEIGYISANGDRRFVKLSETTAWNWQQGAQLQWLQERNTGRENVLFNDCRSGHPVATIVDPISGSQRMFDYPIYTVNPSGRYALSLNYARLFDTRKEYGIAGCTDPYKDVLRPEHDGVFSLDLHTGARKLIISIAQVAAISPSPLGVNAKHWVNHMMFNPSGTRFCFLHLFWREDKILHSRLFTSDAEGQDLRLLFEGMVSHYCWRDDCTLLAWAGKRRLLGSVHSRRSILKTSLRRCLKPIYYAMGKPRILMQKVMGDSFYLIEDKPEGAVERFGLGKLMSDGHCTFSPDRRWVLTDGYTDSKNRLPLFLYDAQEEAVAEIGRFPTPNVLDGPVRVDLHPRFSRDGTQVCIDSAMDGTRQMYIIDVSDVVRA